MFAQNLALAMLSPTRQRAFRRAVVIHGLVLLAAVLSVVNRSPTGTVLLGQLLLVTGIVEGALLVGWRLTQIPKSQALEFLLITPQLPRGVFLSEALTGLARFALITLSGLPVLVWLILEGKLLPSDLGPLLFMPFTWGAVTALGLTTWAYEPLLIRKLGERVIFAGILVYLGLGVLAGEHLKSWLEWLPFDVGGYLMWSFRAFHELNPFGVMQGWMEPDAKMPPLVAQERMLGLELAALTVVGLLLVRAASRLRGHFQDRHYRPAFDPKGGNRGSIGDQPLTWWAVRRVTEYAGQANLWLAAGFGTLYAAHTVFAASWPSWLGKIVFVIFDYAMGGIPVIATALVILAAVPAAWQYGLWDNSTQDRCRRLELLLLTELEPLDYWKAARAAAWRRGRGYFWTAVLLWLAAWWSGQATGWQAAAALLTAGLLWQLYFVLGFRGFSRGSQANGLGTLLTLGLPAATYVVYAAGWPLLGLLFPPGSVYSALKGPPGPLWALGPVWMGAASLWIGRSALQHGDAELRRWYDLNHGQHAAD
ncbi:MAG: hypothetical protein JNM56_16420 [Planctomycetia bacterium]|nr:hypothetical protein [Planctomycetia bacterium]